MADAEHKRPKVVGIGLNKTGTKTLGAYLKRWGFVHRTYDSNTTRESASYRLYASGNVEELLASMEEHDSFEDWPWPLLYREIDARYPDARFVLTLRRDTDTWYRSLCNMAVRIGPLPLYERHVYGSGMPQGRKAEHVAVYEAHQRAVREHFADRPGKLLELSWDAGDTPLRLAEFLGLEGVDVEPLHVNSSPRSVYDGDSLWRAQLHRLWYQRVGGPGAFPQRAVAALRRRLG